MCCAAALWEPARRQNKWTAVSASSCSSALAQMVADSSCGTRAPRTATFCICLRGKCPFPTKYKYSWRCEAVLYTLWFLRGPCVGQTPGAMESIYFAFHSLLIIYDFFFISSSESFRHSLSEWTFSRYLSASKPQNHCCYKSWAKMYNVIRGNLVVFVSEVGLYKATGIYHYFWVRITGCAWSLNVALFCFLLPLEN